MIHFKKGAELDNPRDYRASAIDELRQLLEAKCPARCDARRKNFYEIEGRGETYYIHVSPLSGNVTLLAIWVRQPQQFDVSSEQLVA